MCYPFQDRKECRFLKNSVPQISVTVSSSFPWIPREIYEEMMLQKSFQSHERCSHEVGIHPILWKCLPVANVRPLLLPYDLNLSFIFYRQ